VNARLGHPVAWSLCTAMWLHLGTVAFGALIVAIIDSIRLTFDYIRLKMKEVTGAGTNASVGCCLKCMGCLIDCFERFIRFINRHAYI